MRGSVTSAYREENDVIISVSVCESVCNIACRYSASTTRNTTRILLFQPLQMADVMTVCHRAAPQSWSQRAQRTQTANLMGSVLISSTGLHLNHELCSQFKSQGSQRREWWVSLSNGCPNFSSEDGKAWAVMVRQWPRVGDDSEWAAMTWPRVGGDELECVVMTSSCRCNL